MLLRSAATLGRHAPLLLAAGVFIGLIFPALAQYARPLLTPAVFLMLTASLIRLDPREVAAKVRQPLRLGLLTAWYLAGAPVLMAVAVTLLDLPEGLGQAMIVQAASPPLLSSPAMALVMGFDAALALVAMLLATLVHPFTVPPVVGVLIGVDLQLSVGGLMLRLALLVAGAGALAMLGRRILGPARLAGAAPQLDLAIVALMIVFAIAIMDGVAARIAEDPARVGLWVAGAFAANLLLQGAGLLVFLPLEPAARGTVMMASGNRNMALVVAALGPAAGPDLLLFFAVGQFPIYLLPALLKPVYRRLAG